MVIYTSSSQSNNSKGNQCPQQHQHNEDFVVGVVGVVAVAVAVAVALLLSCKTYASTNKNSLASESITRAMTMGLTTATIV